MFTENPRKAILRILFATAVICFPMISSRIIIADAQSPKKASPVRAESGGYGVLTRGGVKEFAPPALASRVMGGMSAMPGKHVYRPMEGGSMAAQGDMSNKGIGPVQDVNLTAAPSDDIHPGRSKDLLEIYFASNATSVDPNTGKLTGTGTEYHIWKMAPDGSLPSPVTFGDAGNQIHPVLSPGGNLLAYAQERAPGSRIYDIWLYNLVTQVKTRLTNNTGDNIHPTWSSSGTRLAFQSTMGGGSYKIWAIDMDGRNLTQLTFGAQADTSPAWSPNGQKIAFVRNQRIFIMDSTGSNVLQVTNQVLGARTQEKDPAWSPLTTSLPMSLVFASTRKDVDGDGSPDLAATTYDLYVMPDGTKVEDGAGNKPYSLTSAPGEEEDPCWFNRDVIETTDPVTGERIYSASGVVLYTSNRQGTQGVHDIWRGLVNDIHAPDVEVLPQITPRLQAPGQPVTVRANVTDGQSGVQSVYAQFKDPDSALQDADGLEHKIYYHWESTDKDHAFAWQVDSGAFIWPEVEVGCEAIDPYTYTYHLPYFMTFTDGHWLELYDDGPASKGGHEPEGETAGDSWYTSTWTTPTSPSDYYMDLIVRDKKGNEQIYDNIWGFSTRTFSATNSILLVLDYGAGQDFMQSMDSFRGDTAFFLGLPTESYLTDNPTMFPRNYQEYLAGVKDGDGRDVVDQRHTLAPRVPYFKDAPLGWEQTVIYEDLNDYYDIWRVQCREPITQEVLSAYAPRMVQQPDENDPSIKINKLMASKCVFWASPYAGDLRVGPGTIIDPAIQQKLIWYLNQGGRLLITGQDVGWALTMNGVTNNELLANYMRVSYKSDAAGDTISVYAGQRHHMTGKTDSGPGMDPISNDTWKWHWMSYGRVDDFPKDPDLAHPTYFRPYAFIDPTDPNSRLINAAVYPFITEAEKDKRGYDGCTNQWWIDSIEPAAGARVAYTYESGGTACVYYEDPMTRYKVAYMAFGLEGVHSEYRTYESNNWKALVRKSYRAEIAHNIACWMRHGSFNGYVYAINPSSGEKKPLADALVYAVDDLRASYIGQTIGTALSRQDGAYTITCLDSSIYMLYAYVPGYTIQHDIRPALHGGMDERVDIVLTKAPAGWISGKVTDSNGLPVAGATVTATESRMGKLIFKATTQMDGTYRINDVENGEYEVTCAKAGYGASAPEMIKVVVQPNTEVPGVDFVLKANPGSISGKVTNAATGAALEAATVQAFVTGTATLAGTAYTDANGLYSLTGIDAGPYTVTASKPGFNSQTKAVQVTSGTTVGADFALTTVPPGSMSGLVTRAGSNTPLKGALVKVSSGGVEIATVETTDPVTENGYTYNYRMSTIPAGFYRVDVSMAGLSASPKLNVEVKSGLETKNVNFTLNPLHIFPIGLAMISVPYDYAGQNLEELLGTTNIKMATWLPAYNTYAMYPEAPANTFKVGSAYFIKLQTPVSVLSQGAEMPSPMNIELDPGWNMVGCPFPGDPINWSSCRILSNGTEYSIAEAASRNIIRGTLWEYVGGNPAYRSATTFEPWKGYWIRAITGCTLIIKKPAN